MDGYIDRGYLTTNSTSDVADTKLIGSNAGTTTFGIKVNEDLGKGLTVGLSINTDWGDQSGASASAQVVGSQQSGFANSQTFLHLTSKDMGTIRVGSPNTFTLTNATGVSAPGFSTGVGSQYSSAYAIAAGAGTGTTGRVGIADFTGTNTATQNFGGARAIRSPNTIQYSSPSFSGASVHIGYTQANNNVLATTTLGVGNTPGVMESAIRYTNGPVDAMYSTIKYTVGSNGMTQSQLSTTAGVTTIVADTNAAQTSQQSLLGVAYTVMPNLKLNFGSGTYSSSTGTYQGSSKNYGGTYTMGQFDLMVLASATDDKSTANVDKKMTGYGLNYNLSKQTRAYVRMDNLNYGSNATAVAGSSVKRTALGISKSF